MTKIRDHDTIAAIATPQGEGAIAVIRVSGASAITVVDSLFSGKVRLVEASGYTAHFGRFLDRNGDHIDDVIVTVFREPSSYTGEDSAEVSCHGGLYIPQKILSILLSNEVRQADPGEFTKRAFLNSKIDLSQAEAVADLIASRSEAFHRASMSQLEGRFSESIRVVQSEVLSLGSLVELELDFNEEGIALVSGQALIERMGALKRRLKSMVDTFSMGKIYREGARVVIIGKPNAGKSSLFNALLRENRAIVTEIPGTTRDSLEENITINGILFRICDTAGLRETHDPVESEGVVRTRRLIEDADLLLFVVDSSESESLHGDMESLLCGLKLPKKGIIAFNKIDLLKKKVTPSNLFEFNGTCFQQLLLSVKSGEGMNRLRDVLGKIDASHVWSEGVQVTSIRHHNALVSSIEFLDSAILSVRNGLSGEFVSLDIRSAADALAEITGEISTEDMLNNIFQQFCIGK